MKAAFNIVGIRMGLPPLGVDRCSQDAAFFVAATWPTLKRRARLANITSVQEARKSGKLRGIGCAVFCEPSGGGAAPQEQAAIKFGESGNASLYVLAGPSGQGPEPQAGGVQRDEGCEDEPAAQEQEQRGGDFDDQHGILSSRPQPTRRYGQIRSRVSPKFRFFTRGSPIGTNAVDGGLEAKKPLEQGKPGVAVT
jgi:hypothetical protein